jgi:hypothetical protein
MTDYVFVHHDPTCVDNGTTDPISFNFIPTSLQESFDLISSLQNDLMLREMGIEGDLKELHMLLIERLDMEHDLNKLQLAIAACEPNADASMDPAKLIPCALHLEIRMGLKISTMILAGGLNRFLIKSEQVTFIECFEKITIDNIFGSPESPLTWHFPSAAAKGESGLLVMGDVRVPAQRCVV